MSNKQQYYGFNDHATRGFNYYRKSEMAHGWFLVISLDAFS